VEQCAALARRRRVAGGIFERADIISLTPPLLPETTGMIDAALLGRLRPAPR